jgi:hypothetical protein
MEFREMVVSWGAVWKLGSGMEFKEMNRSWGAV